MQPLSNSDQGLLADARVALANAHAPYSGFRVGAALLAADGRKFVGANVENASYGLTVCAERVALLTAIAAGAREIVVLAVTTEQTPTADAHGMPCGACRQVMAEFMNPEARVLVDRIGNFALSELLPLAFVLKKP